MTNISTILNSFNKRFKTVLVTGGAGAIGSNLVRSLLTSTVKKIVIVDDLSSGYRSNIPQDPRIVFIKGDIVKDAVLKKAFQYPVDIVFHLAAHFANQNSVEHPIRDLLSNTLGTVNLLEFARRQRIKRFIYFSTSCVYKSKNEKLMESDLDLQFETPYAISKYAGEKYIHFYHRFHKLPGVILRIFNSFGPGEKAGPYRNVIPNFFHKALQGESLVVTGTGKESRNFTFVGDIVRGALLASLSEKAVGHTINLGSDKKIPIATLARAINKLTGNKKPIQYKPRRKWDNSTARDGHLELAMNLLGFKAEIPFEKGLEETYKVITADFKKKA